MITKIRKLASASIQSNMMYRVNFIIGSISTFILFFVHYNLWNSIYKINRIQIIGGFTLADMIIYVAIARILSVLSNSLSIERKVSTEIKDGTLSVFLIKPINYLLYNLSSKLGNMLIQFCLSLLIYVILFITLLQKISSIPDISTIILIIFTSFMGIIINSLIGYNFALTALWVEHVDILFVFKSMLITFVSGVLIPINFFPMFLRDILNLLPFKYLIAFPIDIYLKNVKGIKIIHGIGMQLLWIFFLLLISRFMWKKGIKQYNSVRG